MARVLPSDGRTLYFPNGNILLEVDLTPGSPPRFGHPRPPPDAPIDRIDVVLGWEQVRRMAGGEIASRSRPGPMLTNREAQRH